MSPRYQARVKGIASKKADMARTEILSRFNNHAVTKEIESGPTSKNISGLLGGYGNLFSYIGFHHNARPISLLRKLLEQIRVLKIDRTFKNKGYLFVQNIRIRYPSQKEVMALSQMPWEPKSWVYGIEKGIDGFGYYMNTRFRQGRSKHGLQAEHRVNDIWFKTTKYLPSFLLEGLKILKRK